MYRDVTLTSGLKASAAVTAWTFSDQLSGDYESGPRPCVQRRARRHGNTGSHGNDGIVESATYRI
jgi:hypothetical protein